MNRIPLGQSISSLIGLMSLVVVSLVPYAVSAQETSDKPAAATTEKAAEKDAKDKQAGWKPLKGKWKACQFGGDGPIEFKGNVIQMGFGDPLTGIHWEGDVVRENYEIELEARRTDGFDFFCGLTLPVGEDCISFILGGWGGGVVGISSIDGRDASENDTTSFRNFDNDKWYKVRVRVEPNKITCWIDDKIACDHERKGFEFDIRYEMDPCTPLGIAAFQCKSEIRNIRVRKLAKEAGKKK